MVSNDANSKPSSGGQADKKRAWTPRAEFDANDLLAIVGHDLMAPLTNVTALAARIKNLAACVTPVSSIGECAEDILRSAAAMQQLIDDLQVGSAAAVPPEAAGQPQDIAPLIARAIDIFQPLAASASIRLTSDVTGPIVASCDAPRLFAALAHLIDLAMKFTAAGALVHVSASSDDGECTISVLHRGTVIDKSERLAALAIARAIIEAHGGRLWVDSHPGIGNVFYFTLPLV